MARNQLVTGARCLSLGNFAFYFAQLHEFALNSLSPLFHRDVEKSDKQDDRAASRLFSAKALERHFTLFPDRLGLSVYLFILGEMVDAWQNRSIPHIERV